MLELLIVVAIILIIATIAIPSLLRSRQSANETAAVADLKTLTAAQITYSSGLSGAFGTIPQLVSAGLLDNRYNGPLSGYNYSIAVSPNGLDFSAFATAISSNSGRYDYYTTVDYVIRFSTDSTRAPSGQPGNPVQ